MTGNDPDVTQPREDRRWELLLLLSSLVAALLFGTSAYREYRLAPWRAFQSSYRAILFERAQDERGREAAATFETRYYQYYLPALERVDRCPTCHVSIEDPLMANALQPLTTHPGDYLRDHPTDRFGCTICHGGQGRATVALEAHGEQPGRRMPLRRGKRLQAGCAECHTDAELPGVPTYNLAQSLFVEKACLSCHTLRGIGGTLAPDLTGAAEKHSFEWQVEHFLDPQVLVPGSKMPKLELSHAEAEALAHLMMSFSGVQLPRDYLPSPGAGGDGAGAGSLSADRLGANIDPRAAAGYVGSETCLICHDGLHPEAMQGWKSSKMAHAFLSVRDAPDQERCLACHTTGFNPATGHFSELNVACEACHGPGKEYVPLILEGKVLEHRSLALGNVRDRNPCVGCHYVHVPREEHESFIRRTQPLPKSSADEPASR